MVDESNTDGGRKYFRIPIDDSSKVSILIQAAEYTVINLAPRGVGIFLNNRNTFEPGDKISNIILTINETSCQAIGRIAHISPENENYLCGIEFIDMDQKITDLLQQFIDNHKKSLFSFMPD